MYFDCLILNYLRKKSNNYQKIYVKACPHATFTYPDPVFSYPGLLNFWKSGWWGLLAPNHFLLAQNAGMLFLWKYSVNQIITRKTNLKDCLYPVCYLLKTDFYLLKMRLHTLRIRSKRQILLSESDSNLPGLFWGHLAADDFFCSLYFRNSAY